DATSQRVIGFNTSHNAPGARLDSQPAPVNRAQGRDVIRVDTQCAIQIVLTPSRSAEDLVRIVRAALASHEHERIVGINPCLRRVESLEPLEQPRDREVNLAILMLYQAPHLFIDMGTKRDTRAAGADLVEERLTERITLSCNPSSSHCLGLLSSEAVG